MTAGLGREDIRSLLDDLSAELAARGARAELFLVGGAALAVAYDATRATRDLDAVFIPTDVVRQAAATVAEHQGLAEDWLNDAVGKIRASGVVPYRLMSARSRAVGTVGHQALRRVGHASHDHRGAVPRVRQASLPSLIAVSSGVT
jgi:hypothetical protein